jgi:hypothetical protein
MDNWRNRGNGNINNWRQHPYEKNWRNPQQNKKCPDKSEKMNEKKIEKNVDKSSNKNEENLLAALKNILDDEDISEVNSITITKVEPQMMMKMGPRGMHGMPKITGMMPGLPPHIMQAILSQINSDEESDDKKDTSPKEEEFKIDIDAEYDEINCTIKTLDDLIKLGKSFDPETAKKYPFNLKKLNDVVPTMEKLQNVIGMTDIKTNIINQILYFLSGIEPNDSMLHTVILGPPGVGKTMVAQIIGEIYFKLGIIKGDGKKFPFIIAKRDDLIAGYLGQTAGKTQATINKAKGGVLFIDEVYQLGSGSDEKRDIFSKECIDTINQNLTENKLNFICIIAGYPEQVQKCFFDVNEGLKRRFPFVYSIEKYTAMELAKILDTMAQPKGWKIADITEVSDFIKENYDSFPNFGGDIETWFFNIRVAHALRVFGLHPRNRKNITKEDLQAGFKLFMKEKKKEEPLNHMYL